MREITFTIKGMHCERCAERAQSLLRRQHGVREAQVRFAGGPAIVRFNPHAIAVDQLIDAVEAAGFQVTESA